eukprot:750329-Hanusia_phi.AAC.2
MTTVQRLLEAQQLNLQVKKISSTPRITPYGCLTGPCDVARPLCRCSCHCRRVWGLLVDQVAESGNSARPSGHYS